MLYIGFSIGHDIIWIMSTAFGGSVRATAGGGGRPCCGRTGDEAGTREGTGEETGVSGDGRDSVGGKGRDTGRPVARKEWK